MWEDGKIDSYYYEVKVYDEPSKFGINKGRVSKLIIYDSDKQTVCQYDRRWVIKPNNDEVKDVFNKIMNLFA